MAVGSGASAAGPQAESTANDARIRPMSKQRQNDFCGSFSGICWFLSFFSLSHLPVRIEIKLNRIVN
jgi:hypothetical protein